MDIASSTESTTTATWSGNCRRNLKSPPHGDSVRQVVNHFTAPRHEKWPNLGTGAGEATMVTLRYVIIAAALTALCGGAVYAPSRIVGLLAPSFWQVGH
jgi:hypothetical protein